MHRLKIRHSLSFALASLFAMASLGVTACNLLDSSPVSSNESSSSAQTDNLQSSSSVSLPWLHQSSSSSLTQPTEPYNSSSSASSSSGSKPISSSSEAIISGEIVSCDMHMEIQGSDEKTTLHFCAEIPASSFTEELRTTCADDESLGWTASLGTACPGDAVLTCTETQDGITSVQYYYGTEFEDQTCEQVSAD